MGAPPNVQEWSQRRPNGAGTLSWCQWRPQEEKWAHAAPPPPQVLSTRVLAEGGGMMGLTATHNLVVMKQFLSVPIRGGVL